METSTAFLFHCPRMAPPAERIRDIRQDIVLGRIQWDAFDDSFPNLRGALSKQLGIPSIDLKKVTVSVSVSIRPGTEASSVSLGQKYRFSQPPLRDFLYLNEGDFDS